MFSAARNVLKPSFARTFAAGKAYKHTLPPLPYAFDVSTDEYFSTFFICWLCLWTRPLNLISRQKLWLCIIPNIIRHTSMASTPLKKLTPLRTPLLRRYLFKAHWNSMEEVHIYLTARLERVAYRPSVRSHQPLSFLEEPRTRERRWRKDCLGWSSWEGSRKRLRVRRGV